MISFGGAIKRTGANGEVGGYLVRFSDASSPDLDGEYFTKDTYLGPRDGDESDCLFDHGIPIKRGLEKLADEWFAPIKTRRDEIGVWASTILKESDSYQAEVLKLIDKGKIGWSSGSAPHLVKKNKNGEITRWPIVEGSLTHMPAEPRNVVLETKSFRDAIGDDQSDSDPKARIESDSLAEKEPGIDVADDKTSAGKSFAGKSVADFYRSELAEYTNSYTINSAMECALNNIDMQQDAADKLGITIDTAPMIDDLLGAVMVDLRAYCLQRLDESGDDDDMDVPMASNGYMMSLRHPIKTLVSIKHSPESRLPLDIHSKIVVSAVEELLQNSDAIGEPLNDYAKHVTDKHQFRIKDGRVLSAAIRDHLTATHGKMGSAKDHMTEAQDKIQALLDATAPKPKPADTEKAKSLRMRLLRDRCA